MNVEREHCSEKVADSESNMNNTTETISPLLMPFDYVSSIYMAVVITVGTSLNITSVVRLFEAIKVSFISF